MKPSLWIIVAVLVIGSAAIGLVALGGGPEYTTASPEALAELEAAMEARMKLYHREAATHLEKAVELDPDFVLAKVMLSELLSKEHSERRDQLLDEIAAADLDRLTPRERFLAKRRLLLRDERYMEYAELIGAYLERHPDDPWVLDMKAAMAWRDGRSEEAEKLYQRLIEISPNWVIAYNMMGYITMGQGRFEEAEEYFTSYRFIAPDQANPHDSLGELFIATGRWDEAETTLEEAIRIKEDFWPSYRNLFLTHLLTKDFDAARQVAERFVAVEDAPEGYAEAFRCVLEYAQLVDDRDWHAILARVETEDPCMSPKLQDRYPAMVTHLAASRLGKWEIAEGIESTVQQLIDKSDGKDSMKTASLAPFLSHLRGVRSALQGGLDAAEKLFRDADDGLVFEQASTSIFKLNNQLCLAETLLAQGREAEAHHLLTRVRTINPLIVVEFEQHGLQHLGIEKQR
jgi:tetratricopeptide (TPR) repeat protein